MSIFVQHSMLKHKHKNLKGIGPNDHHRKWSWADEQGWVRFLKLPYSKSNGWTKSASNPILSGSGVAGRFDKEGVMHPCVIKVGNTYFMYFIGQPSNNNYERYGRDVGLATSTDGVNFTKYGTTPVIQNGGAGAWDENIASIAVIYDETEPTYKFQAWYLGRPDAAVTQSNGKIGHAYSTDGYSWTKNPSNPVYEPNNYLREGIAVFRMGNMYYMVLPNDDGNYYAVATSSNKTSWTLWGNILAKGTSGWDSNNVRYGTLFWNLGVWYLVYAGNEAGVGWKGGLATSYSGFRTFDKWPYNPVISTGGTGEFDEKSVFGFSLLMVDDGFKLYYTGQDTASPWSRKIGLAAIS